MKVLIVDDSLTVRMDLKNELAGIGFDCSVCATLTAARDICNSSEFDLIILDIILPDGDGCEFLEEIRISPKFKETPVMLLSSEQEVKDRIRGLNTGANEYIGKPYDLSHVVRRARELSRSSSLRTGATILIIDDSETYSRALKEDLEGAGYTAIIAGNGEEGLRRAEQARPDAVIVDRQLPDIDGTKVIQSLRNNEVLRRIPCILLTASDHSGAEREALEAGADIFVRKGEEIAVTLARLNALLRTATHETIGSESDRRMKRLLAVDDSPTYLNALGEEMRQEGYDVVGAQSGFEAIELLSVQPVDAILLDLKMPDLSGGETCSRIKANPKTRDIPLLMLTAVDDSESMQACLNAGADDYIVKSDEFGILKARLKAQLRRQEFEAENRKIRNELLKREIAAVEFQAIRELAETRATSIAALEQKNAELEISKQATEIVAKELEAFSYSVSHDLRAPLRHISGFIELALKNGAAQMDEKTKRNLQVASESAERMGRLIDDLLTLSRIGRAEIVRSKVDLNALIDEVRNEFLPEQEGRNITWQVEKIPVVLGDRNLLRLVLENLLGNSLKFTRNITEAAISVFASLEGPEVVIEIKDNGAGFEMKYIDKLFGVFQRLHRMEDFAGTGIGLASVKRVILRHGGRVWATGKVNEGASFFFSLPTSAKQEDHHAR